MGTEQTFNFFFFLRYKFIIATKLKVCSVPLFHFIVFITSSVVLFLSNKFTTNNNIKTISKTIAYAIKLNFQLPITKYAPASVEEITEGNLTKVDIQINLRGFTGNN